VIDVKLGVELGASIYLDSMSAQRVHPSIDVIGDECDDRLWILRDCVLAAKAQERSLDSAEDPARALIEDQREAEEFTVEFRRPLQIARGEEHDLRIQYAFHIYSHRPFGVTVAAPVAFRQWHAVHRVTTPGWDFPRRQDIMPAGCFAVNPKAKTKVRYVDGRRLYYAFMAGAEAVARDRSELNRINVFPVADGDTGTNLTLTLNHILDDSNPHRSLHSALDRIAQASLAGARGNSGMILAQLLNGMAAELQGHSTATAPAFGSSLLRAVPHAYKAVAQPVEGTMLTVLRAWAETFGDLCQSSRDLADVLTRSLERAREALRKTPEQLEVLRRGRVVDSGAQGLVRFLEGIAGLTGRAHLRSALRRARTIRLETTPVEGEISTELTARYCAEGYLTGSDLPQEDIRTYLQQHGDSVIVAGGAERLRFHLHTDHPAELFTELRSRGTFLEQKVDDMVRQQDALYRRRFSVALATDSIADIPQEILDAHQIHLLPLQVLVDGSAFLDRVTLAPGQLFGLLEQVKEYPTSSQPTARQAREWLEFLSTHYESVVVLAVSSPISGTYQTLRQAAEPLIGDGNRISVIDTRLNSGAQGLLVLKAAEALAAGATHDELVERIEQWISRTRIFVSVATFEYMVRGGRVSPLKGKLGKWLNLKPIVSLDEHGKGVAFGKAFSRRANTKKIMETVTQLNAQAPIDKYCIVHADAPDKAREYERRLTALLGKPPAYITEISPIVALNAGRGAVAVALMQEDSTPPSEDASCGS